jgi:hypothetical protein
MKRIPQYVGFRLLRQLPSSLAPYSNLAFYHTNSLGRYMLALNQTFIISIAVGGIATCAAFFVEWKSVKGKKLTPGGAA